MRMSYLDFLIIKKNRRGRNKNSYNKKLQKNNNYYQLYRFNR